MIKKKKLPTLEDNIVFFISLLLSVSFKFYDSKILICKHIYQFFTLWDLNKIVESKFLTSYLIKINFIYLLEDVFLSSILFFHFGTRWLKICHIIIYFYLYFKTIFIEIYHDFSTNFRIDIMKKNIIFPLCICFEHQEKINDKAILCSLHPLFIKKSYIILLLSIFLLF